MEFGRKKLFSTWIKTKGQQVDHSSIRYIV